MQRRALDALAHQFVEIIDLKIGTDLAEAPAEVRWDQVQQLLRWRRKASNAQVIANHHYRNIHVPQQIQQVIVGHAEFDVAVLQFFVERGQFLVTRLQFFFGGLQLFVGALQLLIGRQYFFIGRLELLRGHLVFFNQGLQLLA